MGMKQEKISTEGRRRDGPVAASITTNNMASSSSSSFRASPCTDPSSITPVRMLLEYIYFEKKILILIIVRDLFIYMICA